MKKIVLAVLLLGMLAACSFPQPTTSPSDSQTQVALFAQATLTKAAVESQAQQTSTSVALQPTTTESSAEVTPTNVPPTATSIPPTATAIPPTATSVPTVVVTPVQPTATTAPGQAIRLSFASGTTNITAEGQLAANATRRYVFWADKSQLMDISSSGAYIAVTSPSGKMLVDFDQGWTWYRDYISEKDDWYIDIKAGNYAANYSLYLAIPQRLSFAPNTSSMTAKATIPAGRVHNFVAWGNKDQTLSVSISPTQNFKLSIWHVDGTVLLSGMGDSTSFEGVLPEAGDYIINVTSGAATATEITLNLSIN